MTPFWHGAAVAALGLAALGSAAVSLAVVRRSHARWQGLSRRVDELSLRLRVLEGIPGGTGGLPAGTGGDEAIPAPAGKPPVPPGWLAHRRLRVDTPAPAPPPVLPLIAVPSMTAAGSEAVARDAGEALARRFGPIWALADAGETAEAIAGATGHPIGQVELILGLRGPAVRHG